LTDVIQVSHVNTLMNLGVRDYNDSRHLLSFYVGAM
jgi:hypothetical protein